MENLLGSISTQLISSTALTLIHFVWQGALVAIVLKLILTFIPQKYLLTRYRLAVTALAVTVILPCATLFYLAQSPDIVQSTIDYSSKAINVFGEIPAMQSGVTENISTESTTNLTNIESFSGLVEDKNNLLLNLLIAWVVGCLLMLVKFAIDLNSTYRLAKEGVVPVTSQIDEIVVRLARRYKLSRPIQILKSNLVNVPVVVGWLRPVILLPIAISVGLDKAQLELIIAHELAHIKRMDFAVNIIQSLVQIVFFYHPSVHWINQVIREEREYICDAMALEIIGNNNHSKLNLAKALLNTEELREGNFSLIAVAASGGKLKNRISHILEGEYRPATSIKTLLLSVFAFMFSLAAMASTIALESSQKLIEPEKSLIDQVEMIRSRKLALTKESAGGTSVVNRKPASADTDKTVISGAKLVDNPIKNNVNNNRKLRLNRNLADLSQAETEQIEATKVSQVARIRTTTNGEDKPRTNIVLTTESNELLQITNQKPKQSASKQNAAKQSTVKRDELLSGELSSDDKSVEDTHPKDPSMLANRLNQNKNGESYKVASLDLASIKDYSDPKAIYTPYPRYPKQAWSKMVNQTVAVNFVINTDGKVEDVVVQGRVGRSFVREVKRKLRKWRYEPAMDNNRRVEHATSLEFVFKAPQEEKIVLITTGTRIR